jgi:4-hydroxy-2-oxoheptanedioate aldolase
MDMPINQFKRALADGSVLFGLWNSLSGSYAIEAIAGAGFDWLMIDTEHSPNDLETVLTHLQILAAYPTEPVVRVPWNDMVTIKRYLDIGAQTLLIPQINTAEEAQAAVSYTRYPPTGARGVGGTTRATRFGRVKDYAKRAHEEICLLVQVESQQALDNIEAIAAVDGVDGVFIGPADLHASLGYPGETRNQSVTPSINEAIARIRKTGRAPGTILTGDPQDVQRWIAQGAQFVAVGSDLGLLARGAEALRGRFES